MLCLPFLASSARLRVATSPLLLANPQSQPERERLLHLVIGSPEGVRRRSRSRREHRSSIRCMCSDMRSRRRGVRRSPSRSRGFWLRQSKVRCLVCCGANIAWVDGKSPPEFLENLGGFSVMMNSAPSRVVSQGGLSNTRFFRSCRQADVSTSN